MARSRRRRRRLPHRRRHAQRRRPTPAASPSPSSRAGERDPAPVVIARLQKPSCTKIPGLTTYMQPVQDIQIGARVSRTQYQYTLMDTDAAELASLAPPKLIAELPSPRPNSPTSPATSRRAVSRREIVVDRDAATRLGVTMQSIEDVLYDAFGQRQISTIFEPDPTNTASLWKPDPSWIADPGSPCYRLRVPGTVASIGANGAAAVSDHHRRHHQHRGAGPAHRPSPTSSSACCPRWSSPTRRQFPADHHQLQYANPALPSVTR